MNWRDEVRACDLRHGGRNENDRAVGIHDHADADENDDENEHGRPVG